MLVESEKPEVAMTHPDFPFNQRAAFAAAANGDYTLQEDVMNLQGRSGAFQALYRT